MFLIYTESGYLGSTLTHILGGIMGWIKYLLPIGIFAIAIYIACDEKEYLMSKLIQYSIFLLAIAIVMNIYQMSNGNINENDKFAEIVQEAYQLGEKNIGGGAVGGVGKAHHGASQPQHRRFKGEPGAGAWLKKKCRKNPPATHIRKSS